MIRKPATYKDTTTPAPSLIDSIIYGFGILVSDIQQRYTSSLERARRYILYTEKTFNAARAAAAQRAEEDTVPGSDTRENIQPEWNRETLILLEQYWNIRDADPDSKTFISDPEEKRLIRICRFYGIKQGIEQDRLMSGIEQALHEYPAESAELRAWVREWVRETEEPAKL